MMRTAWEGGQKVTHKAQDTGHRPHSNATAALHLTDTGCGYEESGRRATMLVASHAHCVTCTVATNMLKFSARAQRTLKAHMHKRTQSSSLRICGSLSARIAIHCVAIGRNGYVFDLQHCEIEISGQSRFAGIDRNHARRRPGAWQKPSKHERASQHTRRRPSTSDNEAACAGSRHTAPYERRVVATSRRSSQLARMPSHTTPWHALLHIPTAPTAS